MRTSIQVFVIALFLVTMRVYPQSDPELVTGQYIIRNVSFKVHGITNTNVLRQKADIELGTAFDDLRSLEEFLADRRQQLINERVLAQVEVSYVLRPGSPSTNDVDVEFVVQDSWNIIALPYFRYDTNDGFLLSIRARDYNFAGSMQALTLNFDYSRDAANRDSYGFYNSFGLPIRVLGREGGISVSENLIIHADDRPVTSVTNLGGNLVFREMGVPTTFSVSQSLQFNPDQVKAENEPDSYFLSSSAVLSSAIPTGLNMGKLGGVIYSPSLSGVLYWNPVHDLRSDRQGLRLTFGNNLSVGRVDWLANMRDGFSASISNENTYNIRFDDWTVDLNGSLYYHATKAGLFGLNLRASGFYSLTDTVRTSLGTNMRGVKTSRLWGDSALFANLETPVKLFNFPTHVLIGKNWLDFELQAAPFMEAAFVDSGPGAALADKFWYTAGLEFIVYPLRMRNFIVRASAGFDMDAVVRNRSIILPSPRDGQSPYEVFFGLGLFF